MLTSIFNEEFLTRCRLRMITVLSVIKYLFISIGGFGLILFACGLDAPEPYSSGAFARCFICILMLVTAILLEVITMKFLVKDDEYLKTFFDFNY